jgi:periplasmic protein CpxP/Spy
MTSPNDKTSDNQRPRRRWLAGLAAIGGLGLLAARDASAQSWGHGHGSVDPEEMARRLDWRIGRMIKEVGGTTQQKDQIVAIVNAAMTDLKPLRDQRRESRRRGLELLAAPTIDRRALEQVRTTQMQLADTRSRRLTQAFADAAEVLTPEQRTKLAEHLKARRERWGFR